jgi:hypothetical protein
MKQGLAGRRIALLDPDSERTRRMAIITAAVAWFPTAILALMQGPSYLRLFLIDYAAQTRLLFVIPLLIIAEPWMIHRWELIARHFLVVDIIRNEDVARFEQALAVFEKWRHQWISQLVILFAVYCWAVAAVPLVHLIPPWCAGTEAFGKLSWAGASYLLISLPLLVYLVFRWIWNIALWSLFLNKISRFDLRLVPSHPDLIGGLSFLETSLRGYLPFAFAIGTIVAGGVANQMIHLKHSLADSRSEAVFTVVLVLLICVAPLCTFYRPLLLAKWRGTFEYGKFAIEIGHQFEAKWLTSERQVQETALEVPDFSATTDTYSVVANVRQMKPVPFGVQSVARVIVFTLAPAIPVALSSVPFDVLLEKAIKLLL